MKIEKIGKIAAPFISQVASKKGEKSKIKISNPKFSKVTLCSRPETISVFSSSPLGTNSNIFVFPF